MVGIDGINNVTLDNITRIINATSVEEFLVYHNQNIFGGWFWFIMLLVIWVVLYFGSSRSETFGSRGTLTHITLTGALVTLFSFLLRAIYIVIGGVQVGLLTDHQLWLFPIITIVCGVILYSTKDR